jgi:hypothetical protein
MTRNIKKNLVNIPGWSTNRKIVVFESDDWGSIRMPSKKVYNSLLKEGIRVDLCPYNKYDNLASREDLESLFDVLIKYKDFKENHPIFTANTNVANPDFKKIKQNEFNTYYYEPFTATLEKQFNGKNVIHTWRKGIHNGLFYPQLHGREHVNPIIWIDLLKNDHFEIKKAFEQGTFGLSRITSPNIKRLHLAALLFSSNKEQRIIENSIIEGADLFENIFGYRSNSFIAPVYMWDTILEKTFKDVGIQYIQGGNAHNNVNFLTNSTYRVRRHYMGEKNKLDQIYLFRNCFFEPSLSNISNSVDNTLKEIEIAFRWNKPAIISSHRVNYIGSLESNNRDKNLVLLEKLLENIKKKWPTVEFMNSVQLGEIIKYS